jgi:hypothetical protein
MYKHKSHQHIAPVSRQHKEPSFGENWGKTWKKLHNNHLNIGKVAEEDMHLED